VSIFAAINCAPCHQLCSPRSSRPDNEPPARKASRRYHHP